MLPFKVHQFYLSGKHFLLLPKLTSLQLGVLGARLTNNGASVTRPSFLAAKFMQGTVRVSASGLCWSPFDPADVVLPTLPEVLSAPRERIATDTLRAMYFSVGKSQGGTIVRLTTRLESSALWDVLRATGECGLSPDEHAVTSRVLEMVGGRCTMLTSFPFEGASPRIRGGTQYYEGNIDSAEAAATLRQVGGGSLGCSYVPRDATLTFDHRSSISEAKLDSIFRELGEWCFFVPLSARKL